MSKEESIDYAIQVLGLRDIKTNLNIWAVLELIWEDGYEKGKQDEGIKVFNTLGELIEDLNDDQQGEENETTKNNTATNTLC